MGLIFGSFHQGKEHNKLSFKEEYKFFIRKYGFDRFMASRSDPYGKSRLHMDSLFSHYLKIVASELYGKSRLHMDSLFFNNKCNIITQPLSYQGDK